VESGGTVDVLSADGQPLGKAAYSPSSQIRARVWTFEASADVDDAFFMRAVARAVDARSTLQDERHNACRLIHAENDGLPGVVVDRYGSALVVQLLSAGAERWRDAIVAALQATRPASCIYERSDAEVRALEGLPARAGVLFGTLPTPLEVVESGLRYRIDVVSGQKTGFYLDQRDNRALIAQHARGKRVLNAFCYTGAFTVAALAGGATSVLSIDTSASALGVAQENVAINALDATRAAFHEADVFAELRTLRNRGETFDVIVLDPPKFAPTAAHAQSAARAYKDINLLALKLLAPGGLLATFSCSGGVDVPLFQKIVAGAAVDAKADATIVARLTASADHPVSLNFPEGEYLKGLLIRRA
jgi:23S rRNA (cytosine1962-C5)-methyltransferase